MTELVIVRAVRPYVTESEFLQSEDWTVKKNSVFLVAASKHPEGTIVRCELALTSGVQLIVAEGIVAKHVPQTAERPEGVVVRFRRMTPASTQFVNRVIRMREAESSSPSSASHPEPAIAPNYEAGELQQSCVRAAPPPPVPVTVGAANLATALQRLSGRHPSPFAAPQDRDLVLQRLRQRAGGQSHR